MLFTVKTFRMRALATLAVSFSGWCIFGFIGGLRNIGSWSGGPEVDLANYAALGSFIFFMFSMAVFFFKAIFEKPPTEKIEEEVSKGLTKTAQTEIDAEQAVPPKSDRAGG